MIEADLRDFEFWSREAEIAELQQSLDLASAVRVGMASKADFGKYVSTIEWKIKILRKGG